MLIEHIECPGLIWDYKLNNGDPSGIRTHDATVKGLCLKPLDDRAKKMERETGVEPATACLEGRNSAN